MPVIVNISSERWFVDGGLVSDMFSIMVSIALVDPLSYIIDADYIQKRFLRWYCRRKGENCPLTQAEANE